MGLGRVCGIHEEWCADGTCRWCEPLPEPSPRIQQVTAMLGAGLLNGQQAQQAISEGWAAMWQAAGQAQQQVTFAPTNATASSFPWGFATWGHWL